MSTAPRLFILSARLTRPCRDGSVDIRNLLSWRIATDGEDAVRGRYIRQAMTEGAGFSLDGDVMCAEITRAELSALGLPPDATGDA